MSLLMINASDIDTAGVAIDVELPISWLDQALGDADVRGQLPGRVQARLSRSGSEIVVRGRVDAKVSTPCARCLDPAPVDITGELSLLLKPAPPAPPPRRNGAKPAADRTGRGQAPAGKGGSAGSESASRPGGGARGDARHGDELRKASARRSRAGGRASSTGRAEEAHDYEFTSFEAEVDTYDGETVVLDPFVREAILLEMPNFPLCSEACPGIRDAPASPAPSKPTIREIDPRLAPLGALRAKLGAAPPRPKPRSKTGVKLKANVAARPKPKKKRK